MTTAATRHAGRVIATIPLAGSALEVIEYGPADARWTFVHVHANERASLESAVANAVRLSLRVRALTHGGGTTRNITFPGSTGKRLILDPNRMFSEAGVRASLGSLNDAGAFTDNDVRLATDAGAQLLTALTGDCDTWCALHNNTDGGPLSILRYTYPPGSAIAEAVHVSEGYDPDDFFYTTSRRLFDAIEATPANVVLQKPGVADDGSMSVIAAQRGVPYLNIETEHGRTERATRMLEIGVAALRDGGAHSV